ncbi:MAG: DUF4124 domain-containing protein [Pseudomonadales bacterium]
MRQLAILTTILAAMPMLMGADVYRWTDTNGVINYTQQKPDGVQAELISSRGQVRRNPTSSAPAAAAPVASTSQDPSLNAEQQKIMEELKVAEAERKVAYEAAKKDNCERSQSLLKRLSAVGRIRVTGDDGNVTIIGEDERQERISAAQRGVAENCN